MLKAASEPLSWPDLAQAIDRSPKDGTARRLRDDLLKKGELEKLEQLRALERGYRIRVVASVAPSLEVDTPDDLVRANQAAALNQ